MDSARRSTTGLKRQKSTASTDPYQLNFNELRKEYIKDSNIKLPFSKSSFIHYAACPLNIQLGDLKLENELVLTMELVQAPSHMKNTKLTDAHEKDRKYKAGRATSKKQRVEERRPKRGEAQIQRSTAKSMSASGRGKQKVKSRAVREAQYEQYVKDFQA